jgi:hypothetical protein
MQKIIIDLNLEPEIRYKDVISRFNLLEITNKLNSIYHDFLPTNIPGINNMISMMMKMHKSKITYKNELSYWSKTFDLGFHKIMILQLLFEINVNINPKLISLLKDIQYEAILIKNDVKFEATCFLGFSGLANASNNTYSISMTSDKIIKYKSEYDYIKHIFTKHSNAITKYMLSSQLIRYIFENNLSYYEALGILCSQPIFSPAIYTFTNLEINDYIFKTLPIQMQKNLNNCKRFLKK